MSAKCLILWLNWFFSKKNVFWYFFSTQISWCTILFVPNDKILFKKTKQNKNIVSRIISWLYWSSVIVLGTQKKHYYYYYRSLSQKKSSDDSVNRKKNVIWVNAIDLFLFCLVDDENSIPYFFVDKIKTNEKLEWSALTWMIFVTHSIHKHWMYFILFYFIFVNLFIYCHMFFFARSKIGPLFNT